MFWSINIKTHICTYSLNHFGLLIFTLKRKTPTLQTDFFFYNENSDIIKTKILTGKKFETYIIMNPF